MCRSKAQGGRRCPGRAGSKANGNHSKNASNLGGNSQNTNSANLTGDNSSVFYKPQSIPNDSDKRLIDLGYYRPETLSGVVRHDRLNHESYKDFGFSGADVVNKAANPLLLSEFPEISDKELSSLSQEENDMVLFFTDGDYIEFNSILYKTVHPDESAGYDPEVFGFDYEKMKEDVKNLDAAIEKGPKSQKIVYRGIRGGSSTFQGKGRSAWVAENLVIGKEIVFDGYQQTSIDPATAQKFAQDEGGVIYEILTPEGLNTSGMSSYTEEYEVILPRDSRYVVVGKQYQTSPGGPVTVQLVAINSKGEILDGTNSDQPKDLSYIYENE